MFIHLYLHACVMVFFAGLCHLVRFSDVVCALLCTFSSVALRYFSIGNYCEDGPVTVNFDGLLLVATT